MSNSSDLEVLLQLLFLTAYTMAVVGFFLPMFSRRNKADPRVRAAGRFLQLLAITGIIPSLQVILDIIRVIDDLPRLWHPVINLIFNELILISLWGLVLGWSVLARVYSPSNRMSDRLHKPAAIIVTVVLIVNLTVQAVALITRVATAQPIAQYVLLLLFAILALVAIEAIARIYIPIKKSSEKTGLAPLRLIPPAICVSAAFYVLLPTSLNLLVPPLALIGIFTLTILVITQQSTETGNPVGNHDAMFGKAGMTPQEREITLMLAEGLSYKEISARLFIAISTMQTHVSRIYGKTGENSKTELSRKLAGS